MSADPNPETLSPLAAMAAGAITVITGVVLKVSRHYETRSQEVANQTGILEELGKQRLSITANVKIAEHLAESLDKTNELVRLLREDQSKQTIRDEHQASDHAKELGRTESAIRELQKEMVAGLDKIHSRMDDLHRKR
jgi:hypothetical protein